MTNHLWIFSTWWLLIPATVLLTAAVLFIMLHGRRLRVLAISSLITMGLLIILWPVSYFGAMSISTTAGRRHPDSFDEGRCGIAYEKGVIGAGCHINRYQHTAQGGDDWIKTADSTSKLLPETDFFWDATSVRPGTPDAIPASKWSNRRVSPPWWAYLVDGNYHPWKPPPIGHSGTLLQVNLNLRVWLLFFPLSLFPSLWLLGKYRGIRRERAGHCAKCNYDMRASPNKCPECGTIPRRKHTIPTPPQPTTIR
ncbi:MAG TPA: hypothetical protein VHQ47_14205 [Phycisphaerae bacterium]|nr:hypothetical protein [Phycisphaerae bacterium]